MKHFKGQSAMEYLMTYGWAILIVIIVGASLYALGLFNPATWTGAKATGFNNIGLPAAGQWKLSSTAASNQFQLNLKNGSPNRINITSVPALTWTGYTCTANAPAAGTTVSSGGSIAITANCGNVSSGTAYSIGVSISYDVIGGVSGLTETGIITGTVS